MNLAQYMNTFNRIDHAGEVKRLCESVGISRNHFYSARRGDKIGAAIALGFTRWTDGKVDPRTFESDLDWEVLDAYYAAKTDFGIGAFGLAPKARRAAKQAGSGGGKGNPASARSTARR